jgi:hypothetical protein
VIEVEMGIEDDVDILRLEAGVPNTVLQAGRISCV